MDIKIKSFYNLNNFLTLSISDVLLKKGYTSMTTSSKIPFTICYLFECIYIFIFVQRKVLYSKNVHYNDLDEVTPELA